MNTTEITLLLAGFAAGALLAGFLVRAQWSARNQVLQVRMDSLDQKIKEQASFYAASERAMKETFGSLAADALRNNNQTFVTLAESKLNVVDPLRESLAKMDNKINELESKREGAYQGMRTLMDNMQRSAQALDKGTQSLVSALKTSSTRGRYGEIGLRRVVEFAGMTEHCDFLEQPTVASADGILRPDMIIRLPEAKTIVVDAKTPLDAYMKVFETENETEQQLLLAQHARAVKEHLKQLSAKSYWSQFPESPDYVVLYMQIESSFGAALQADPNLIELGIRNNIILATPTTLITLLRTVGFVWQQRHVAENIQEIRDTGIELYNRTTVLLKHFSAIGGGLRSAVNHYNSAVSSLESRFIPQAKKLHSLGSAYTKNVIPDTEQIETAVREIDAPE